MKAWLLTHNPDNWPWEDFGTKVKKSKEGNKIKEVWTCSNTHVAIGDRVFLMRTGDKGRGIFAAGHAVSESYEAEHYNPVKAANGVKQPKIDVEFDWMLDPDKEKILSIDTLETIIPDQHWLSMSSGIVISDDAFKKLELLWANQIGIKNDVYNMLKVCDDITPDKHDGSYELVRETVKAYAELANLDSVTFDDINLIYLMSIIQVNKKRNSKCIDDSSLPDEKKTRLHEVLNEVWKKAENHEYENIAKKPLSIGMVGTGFYTFNKNGSDPNLPIIVIKALINIFKEEKTDIIYKKLQEDIGSIKGINISSFSVMAHCLKPNIFPIMNKNEGFGNIFEILGIKLSKQKKISNYAKDCITIANYKEKNNFPFENYRVMDLIARKITTIDFIKVLEYCENYVNIPYEDPSAVTDLKRKSELLYIKEKGQEATNIIKEMCDACSNLYPLKRCGQVKYLDGSNKKTRDYLWARMRYEGYEDNAESISIKCQKSSTGLYEFSFEVEVENDMVKKDHSLLDKHHTILDIPIDSSKKLVYLTGSNEYSNVGLIDETISTIKDKLKKGEIEKVKVARVIKHDSSNTNIDFYTAMVEGVGALIPYYEHVIGVNDESVINNDKGAKNTMRNKISLNTILYGPPGTGKTYNSKTYAVAICNYNGNLQEVMSLNYETDIIPQYDTLVEEGIVAFTTFHQSYGYEEFIEGIKPVLKDDGSKDVYYDVVPGIFKKFCDDNRKESLEDGENNIEKKPCVFIIDEINRGNISKIFGELITLIETSKREGSKEAMSCILPYTKEKFSVPDNVYILGTMNTADRSIALMDTALRRRFDFVEMMPDLLPLSGIEVDGINIQEMLNKLNLRIEVLYDREHTLGHAFFMSLKDNPNIEALSLIFENKIIPLLQEYFYEDYEKIQLVLGDNAKSDEFKFIKEIKVDSSRIFNGNVDLDDLPEKKYEINKDAFMKLESYKQI